MTVSWDHTAAVTAMIANVNRGKGKSPIGPNYLKSGVSKGSQDDLGDHIITDYQGDQYPYQDSK